MKSRTFEPLCAIAAALFLAACSPRGAANAPEAPKRLSDPSVGVSVELPGTAAGSVAVTPADRYVWTVPYAPNRTFVYFRVMDATAAFLPLSMRGDVVDKILHAEYRDSLLVFSADAKAPDGSDVELYAGFDRENNGIAGFAWQGGKTLMAVFFLAGPDIRADRAGAEAVLAEIWPRLSLSPTDYGVNRMEKARLRYNEAFIGNKLDDNENIDAAFSLFSMRAHDATNYREAINRLSATVMLMDMRGTCDPDVRMRALSALDNFSDILCRDKLSAREQFLYAVGRRDRPTAAGLARLLDALDSPYDPDAKACSQERWNRVGGI